MKIKIATQFSDTPAGRFVTDGPHSGELFRDTKLREAIESGEPIEIDLDGAEGYGSSFLEEAFGGAVRRGYISAPEFLNRLIWVSNDNPALPNIIKEYVVDAGKRP